VILGDLANAQQNPSRLHAHGPVFRRMQGRRLLPVRAPFEQTLFVRMSFAVVWQELLRKCCRASVVDFAMPHPTSLRVHWNAPSFPRNSETNNAGYLRY
jgi:hypothetical protein